MLALLCLTRASKPARKCSPVRKSRRHRSPQNISQRMMIPLSRQIWIKTSSISLPNADKKSRNDGWALSWTSRGFADRSRKTSLLSGPVCVPISGRKAFLQEAEPRKKPRNKSVDRRVWNYRLPCTNCPQIETSTMVWFLFQEKRYLQYLEATVSLKIFICFSKSKFSTVSRALPEENN